METVSKNLSERSQRIRILFVGSGRRVSLMRFFRLSAEKLNLDVELHAADMDGTAPTCQIADCVHRVPSATHDDFVPAMVRICRNRGIDLVIPLIDPILPVIAKARDQIERSGATLMLSDIATINITADKLRTYEHFTAHQISTADTWQVANARPPAGAAYPMILKPRYGSGSVGVVTVHDAEEFRFYARRIDQPAVQELLQGQEYTFDVLVSRSGDPLSIVPRLRIQTRAGEVSKGLTVMDPELIAAARRVVESLPGAWGPLNFQAFRSAKGAIRFTEINPRFGGGYVLSYHAGADFPAAMLLERLGLRLPAGILQPRPDVVLLRYDDELITDLATLRSRGYELPH